MTEMMMKAKIRAYAENCSKLYTGGEKYFNEIDAKIKSDYDLLLSFIEKAIKETGCNDIILSGGMYDAVMKASKSSVKGKHTLSYSLYKIPGDLRDRKELLKCPDEFAFLYSGKEFIFVDDSFYSGKTYNHVKHFIESAGGKMIAAYVFYDGSREKRDEIHSLYRYYDEMLGKDEEDMFIHSTKGHSDEDAIGIKESVVIGNRGTLVLPEKILTAAGLSEGDALEIEVVINAETNKKNLIISKSFSKAETLRKCEEMNNFFAACSKIDLSIKEMERMTKILAEMENFIKSVTG